MKDKTDHHLNDFELVVTGDGSHTLFVPSLNEHYHSTFGAITESAHIFVEAGFEYVSERFSNICILEVGFGTGLNALLLFQRAEQKGLRIQYTGIEPYPPDNKILQNLNYQYLNNDKRISALWDTIHNKASWMSEYRLQSGSTFLKWKGGAEDFHDEKDKFNLVCFDAFAPDVHPQIWELQVFEHIAALMVTGGVLVTYSSKGSVRRALKNAGFSVEKIPGPPGKREMVRAIKV